MERRRPENASLRRWINLGDKALERRMSHYKESSHGDRDTIYEGNLKAPLGCAGDGTQGIRIPEEAKAG